MSQLGRCGSGAVQLAKDVGIPDSDIVRWDIEETKKGQLSLAFLLFSCTNTYCRRSLPGNRRGCRYSRQLHLPQRTDPSLRYSRDSYIAEPPLVGHLRCER